ncbi:methane monooxygenase/ammonia monooxygenase subunit C [Methylomonas methanica]|uniref:Methane monooxygenase/ammonia monooxygenase subunit C n=1 Tax=Methylomonas methanica TaxID=421 RepID=A0A177M5P6_METMH|nr:bacterial ammonia monooxygenase, subunit AmoC [Methylomonas methanica]OAI00380.1 methane monooxygenase/ammonia monooxygenase subunit C [Methylomonas methanica]
MATTTEHVSLSTENPKSLPWYLIDLPKYLKGFGVLTVIYVSLRLYQGAFAIEHGLDSSEPAFEQYWMRLFYIELVIIAAVASGFWGYLWLSRDRQLDQLAPKEEIRRYFTLTMWISIYTFAVYWAGSYFAEQDNSWHQVAIRDTPFTANHIIEFYFNFPLYVILGGCAWLYARTRLPLYAKGISLPLTLAVFGPFMILVSVGFNEWGHTFWFREEFFAAPIHWGFVIGVWFALGVGGILLQGVTRLIELLDRIEDAE